MVRAAAGLAVALALSACSFLPTRVETVIVKVPVETARPPPPELLECVAKLEAPTFVPRADPAASSCLTPKAEQVLVRLVDRALTCNGGWKTWATTPTAKPEGKSP
jgi:hypothetical protein